MFTKSIIATALAVGLLGTVSFVPTTLPAKDSEVARPTCCLKLAYCCNVKQSCCKSNETNFALNDSVAKPSCCVKRAYCGSRNDRCCRSAAAMDTTTSERAILTNVADKGSVAKPTCCLKLAYCCSVKQPCCRGAAKLKGKA